MQVLVVGATAAAGIAIAPAAAQAAALCDPPRPEGAVFYDCESTDTQNKTNMESRAESDGRDLYVTDYANSWNRLKNWDLCTTILFYNAENVQFGKSDQHCYHMTKRENTTASWAEQLTPYEVAHVAYIEIEHSKRG